MRSKYYEHVHAIKHIGYVRLLLIPVVVALVVLTILPAVATFPLNAVLGIDNSVVVSPASMVGMIFAVVVGALLMMKTSKINAANLGFLPGKALPHSGIGAACGAGALALVALIANLFGAVDTHAGVNPSFVAVLVGFVFFVFQGTWEELIYRAYLMPHMSKLWGAPVAIIVSSLMFTLGHGLNPGMTFMPILNLFVASVVFSMIYYRTGSLWITGLAHGMWNFTQGFIFGSSVSGNITEGALLNSPAVPGHALLSGAQFGFEGSILTTALGVALIAALIVIPRKRGARV